MMGMWGVRARGGGVTVCVMTRMGRACMWLCGGVGVG